MKKFFVVTMMAVLLGTVSFSASAQEKKAEQDKGFWFDVSASAGGMVMRNPAGSNAKFGMNRASYGIDVKSTEMTFQFLSSSEFAMTFSTRW